MAQKKNARGHMKKGWYSSFLQAYFYVIPSSTRPLKLKNVKDSFAVFTVAHFLPFDLSNGLISCSFQVTFNWLRLAKEKPLLLSYNEPACLQIYNSGWLLCNVAGLSFMNCRLKVKELITSGIEAK